MRIRSRSTSASPPRTAIISRPVLVAVSAHGSASDRNWPPASTICLTIANRSKVECASRSIREKAWYHCVHRHDPCNKVWLSRYRRLNTIFERSKEHLIAFVAIALSSILSRHLKRLVIEDNQCLTPTKKHLHRLTKSACFNLTHSPGPGRSRGYIALVIGACRAPCGRRSNTTKLS
jgi:hypothetical protein